MKWDELTLSFKMIPNEKATRNKKNKTTHKQSIHIWRKNNYHSSSIFKVDFLFFMARYFIPGYKISNTFINDYWSIYLLLLLFAILFCCLFLALFLLFCKNCLFSSLICLSANGKSGEKIPRISFDMFTTCISCSCREQKIVCSL